VEVLGFHKITDVDKAYFEALFRRIPQIVITDEILDKAVELRQKNVCRRVMPLLPQQP
jgi:hypothetical protein